MSMAAVSRTPRIWDRKDVLPVAIFLVLFLLLFREFFLAGQTIFDRDVTLWEIPARRLCAQLLKEGDFALWTDAYGGGQPFLANLKTAALYPAMALYLWLPFFAAFKLYYLIHAVLTWSGLYFLGKSYALSRRGSFLGASLFVFGGMYLSSFEFYNHIGALTWLPWILILVSLPWRRWVGRLAALAVLWTLSLLAGAPEITLMTLALAALQILFLASDRKRRGLAAALSFLFAILISAAQLLPSFELWRQSARTSTRFTEWPLEAVQLLNLPFADILGNDRAPGHQHFWAGHFFDRGYPLYYSLYAGLAALVLALWALRRLRDRKILFLGAATLLFLILAAGRYSPVHRFFGAVPLVSSIRYPVKFFVGSIFCVCLLAAAGFDQLFEAGAQKKKAGRRWAAGLAGLGLLLALFSRPLAENLGRGLAAAEAEILTDIRASLISAAVLAALVALAVFLSTGTGWRGRFGGLLMIGIAVLDLAYHNRHINPVVPASFFEAAGFTAGRGQPARIFREDDAPKSLRRGGTGILRLARYARSSLYPLTGIADGAWYFFDEDTLDIYPREYRRLSDAVLRYQREERVRLLRTEGCQYYVGHTRMPAWPAEERESSEGPIYFHTIEGAASQVHLVHDLVPAASLEEKLRLCLQEGFDPRRTAIVDPELTLGRAERTPGEDSFEVAESRQGRLRGSVTVTWPAFVVFPGNWASGWRARVDGRPVKVLRANLSSKGVVVPSGRHEVEIEYRPRGFAIGGAVSILALLALGFLTLRSALTGKRPAVSGCLKGPVFL
ncbi:MAG: hypothetical protein A2W03_11595 [Candidatus Aminicenantes bacterium RBG_16_63_16]|nr:MAG: hypothetical protein A2W03_11595 [Candidatus Aminicenantes bacterium RBG_16_63_16]